MMPFWQCTLSCFFEPRVYKPTGRITSSSSRALLVLLLAAGTSLVHAPEVQMGLCCHFLLAYQRKKKKREIKQILAVCFSSSGKLHKGNSSLSAWPVPPSCPHLFCPRISKVAAPGKSLRSRRLMLLQAPWAFADWKAAPHVPPSSRDILGSGSHQLRHIPICLTLVSGSFCCSQIEGQVCAGSCGGTPGHSIEEKRNLPSVLTMKGVPIKAAHPQQPGPAKSDMKG